MTTHFKSSQRGISFIGLLFVGIVLAITGVLAMQVFPTFMEYQAVIKAANKAKEGTTVAEIRASFDKSAQVDNIKYITGKEIDIAKEGDKVVVSFAYQREIHLAGPAFLTLKYTGRSN